MRKVDYNYKERIKKFMFEDSWIEPPLYHNNLGKTLRFDLVSKSEKDCAVLIKNIFDDIFYEKGKIFIIFYGSKRFSWRKGKKYIKSFKLKKIFKKNIDSKDDNYDKEDLRYLVTGVTNVENFKLYNYIKDYFENEHFGEIVFISLKKGVALQLYDSRGFDVLSLDKDFLKLLFKKYEKDIIEYNRKDILASLE